MSDTTGQECEYIVKSSEGIRSGAHPETICRYCDNFFRDCTHIQKTTGTVDGYLVVRQCREYSEIKATNKY